jgi:S-adenosylmethionine hydrolase
VPSPPDTVFFLSDYGTRDEFAGVVRAVLRRLASHAAVIDLTHEVPPFDVAAGARALVRSMPYLGDGVVLAVVDPGVGSARRGIALHVDGAERQWFFVGPDNGLLLPGAELGGVTVDAVELGGPAPEPGAATFDGRDVFAPAAAALCNGASLRDIGTAIDSESLVRLLLPLSKRATLSDGRAVRWCQVGWVDHFGNLQLSASPNDEDPEVFVLAWADDDIHAPRGFTDRMVRRVRAFAELRPGELGLIVDANGRFALVVREGSASDQLGIGTGHVVGLAEPPARAHRPEPTRPNAPTRLGPVDPPVRS